jgi:rare lipoprotein A
MRIQSLVCLLSLLSLLSACTFGVPIGDRGKSTTASSTKKSSAGNPSSYVVFGKRYYVLDSATGFKQRGIASWYGPKFHGRKTSNGETYNMHDMTAAHKTLPIPVFVHVKNLDNGRTAVVRVNDRGPFIDGRIIDLSYAAAKKLGVDGPGTARVEIAALAPGQSQPTQIVRTIPLDQELAQDVPLFVQMGSFSSQLNAENLVMDLLAVNEYSAQISPWKTDSGMYYRVRLGPLYDIEEANAIIQRLKNKGFQSTRIVVQD